MFYPDEIENITGACGWDILRRGSIYSPDVQDALWETDIVREIFPHKLSKIKNMPPKLKQLLLMQIKTIAKTERVDAMSVFALTAERL